MCNDPCKKCGQPLCEQTCTCTTPNYSALGCPDYVGFSCVQLKEKNADLTNLVFPSLNIKTNDTLFTLTNNLEIWKAEYEANKNRPIPLTANSPGTPGQEASDSNYYYRCVATNQWKRTPLSSW